MAESNDNNLEIICCGTRGWVKTIAWFQIILNVVGLLTTFTGMVKVAHVAAAWDGFTDYLTFSLNFIGFDCCIIGVYFGIVLLQAAIHVHVDSMSRWLGYGIICLIFYSHLLIIGTMLFSWLYLLVILLILWTLWGMGMVCVFMSEAEKNVSGSSRPRTGPTKTTTTAPAVPKQMAKVHNRTTHAKNQLPSLQAVESV